MAGERISHVGLMARSPEGHAAKGMAIKGREDLWVEIQANTFRNWVNENLREVNMEVRDLAADLCDGTRLCALVEVLQKKPLRPAWNRRPANAHHFLENVHAALAAVEADGVKLVNIGNTDIVNGNLKLILGLIWSLIVRYQIGRSKFPPRKLMLAWLKAVLPECRVGNFTSDWNSGVCLSALLEYCRPGLFPDWKDLNPRDSIENCRTAMELARDELKVPMVLEPEYLASPFLDELSGMTYLSYFMKEDSPGFHATLRWVNSQLPAKRVNNFTTDWNDGSTLCSLVGSLGGPVPAAESMQTDSAHWETNLSKGIAGGQRLGVQPILKAKDMADRSVEHLGVMAYAAHFQWITPRGKPGGRLALSCDQHTVRVNKTAHFNLELLSLDVEAGEVTAEVVGPMGSVDCRLSMGPHGGRGSFVPVDVGMHRLLVYNEGELVKNCPFDIRAMPDLGRISYAGMEPCAIGSIVEVLINSNGAHTSQIDVTARSPTGRALPCPVQESDGSYAATFQPDEPGEWSIAVTHRGEHIQGGPFTCFVFDPNGVKLLGLEGAVPGRPFSFIVDALGTGGLGDVRLDVVFKARSVPHRMESLGGSRYRVTFTPRENGKHKVYVYFAGGDVRGSPFTLRVGSKEKRRSGGGSSQEESSRRVVHETVKQTHVSGERVASVSQHRSSADETYWRRKVHYNSRTEDREPARSPIGTHSPLSSPEKVASAFKVTQQGLASRSQSQSQSQADHYLYQESSRSSLDQRLSRSHLDDRANGQTNGQTSHSPGPAAFRASPVLSPVLRASPVLSPVLRASPVLSPVLRASPVLSPAPFRASASPVHNTSLKVNGSPLQSSSLKMSSSLLDGPSYQSNGFQRSSVDSVNRTVDTSSNVRVSTMVDSSNARSDSWDALAKTKSSLFNRSLESLDNGTAARHDNHTHGFSSHQLNSHQLNSHQLNSHQLNSHQLNSHQLNSHQLNSHQVNSHQVSSSQQVHQSSSSHLASHPPSNASQQLRRLSSPTLQTSSSSASAAAASASVTGEALRLVAVHKQSTIDVELDDPRDLADVTVQVTGPSRRPVAVTAFRRNDTLSASFSAAEIGEHSVDVRVREHRVPGSPFRTHAYDARAIRVARIPDGVLGRPVEFQIDGSCAGSGNLEILVNGGHVTSFVRNLGNQRFLASFVPHEELSHLVDMKFNGETVPGSPWQVSVMAGAKMAVLGEAVRLVASGSVATFELSALGFSREDVDVQIVSPSKRAVSARLHEDRPGEFRVEFSPVEVGTHAVEVSIGGQRLPAGPLLAKVYDSALIKVTDVGAAVVGQPAHFRVDASQAGEGQLEISINEGEVPNHVQVVGGGRCLVSFTPELAKPHLIDIKFNGETVVGCPFVCAVSDTSRVSLTLRNLELVPVNEVARFHMGVDGSGSAELAVSVRGPNAELPVKVTGNVHSGFTAEFTPRDVGGHAISVEYNGHAVAGTPFVAKAYDGSRVFVGPIPKGAVGKTLQFMVDASQAGEGNLEITISARGHNIPTQVHPQGNARFAVSFVPIDPTDHVISINFNKEAVPGSPFVASVMGDSSQILVSGPSLSSAGVGKTSFFTMSNVAGSVEDIEVNVEGPSGAAVPATVKESGAQSFRVEFSPRAAGEHRVSVAYRQVAVAGSPFACKVYDVAAIRVKDVGKGVVGKPITFLVETSQAGPGNLEVTVNGGRVPTSAQAQGPHTYAISFTPRQAAAHTVDLRFNGEDVPGSPFECVVSEAARVLVSAERLEKVAVGRESSFAVESDARPEVAVLGPSRRPLLADVAADAAAAGCHRVAFTPVDVGDHSVEVKVDGAHAEGSPFLVKAYDAGKVKVTDINSGVVGKPVYFSINASQAGAGNLEIIVSVAGRNVPNYVQSEGNAKFKVNFRPQDAAPHSLSVRFNGEPVPGSPFACRVVDGGAVLVSGGALKMAAVGRPTSLSVDPQSEQPGELEVTVTSPAGLIVPCAVVDKDDKFTAEFTPVEVGRHSVSVILDGEPVKGSPFACNAYDVGRVRATGLAPCKVGKPATFSVDASEAGEGTLELVVSTDKATVKAEVVACARGLYDVTFVPHDAVPHFVSISFNEEDVPGSPFPCAVLELNSKEARRKGMGVATARGDGLSEVLVGRTAFVDVDPRGGEGRVDMEVTGPNGASVACFVKRLATGMLRAEYTPHEVGVHRVTILQDGQPISKLPFAVDVFDPSRVKLLDMEEAFCNRAASLKVDTSQAGRGALSASVKAAGLEVKHSLKELGGGQHLLTYEPQLAVPHRVDIKYNGMHVAGCPFEVSVKNPAVGQDVIATGLGLYQSRAGKTTTFVIETLGHPAAEFDVLVTGPHGAAVPVRCYQQKDGNLQAEFTAQPAGSYKIEVTRASRPVRGSPYYCQVFDASKVTLDSVGSKAVAVSEKIAFKLLRKDAGFAELDVTVTSPLGQDLPLEVKSGGDKHTDLIEFSPSVPGNYRFNITYGGVEVPGSPVTFAVEESGAAKAWGDGLTCCQVDVSARFKVTGPATPGRPHVTVDGPGGAVAVAVEPAADGGFDVTYVPLEVGVLEVRVSWAELPLPGSPFRPRAVDPRRVRVVGGASPGAAAPLQLQVHNTARVSVDTADAGPGQLTAECRGPGGAAVPVAVEPTSPSRVRLLLTPRAPGEHVVSLRFAGFPLPSPPLVGVAEVGGAAAPVRVVLTGRGLAAARCGEEAEFIVDGSQAGPGEPTVTLTGNKADVLVALTDTGNSVYRASYTPPQPGTFLLNVMWSERQVKGCPLKVAVVAVADSSRVVCSGEGLRVGTVGKEIRSFIDTRRAGPGELTAHCVGPHKVAYCELYDHADGTFTLNVKPQEAGRHALTVKYGGGHVAGSPFSVRVAGAPDPSKVRVYGPGVEHGVLATFQSRFICDTRGAGAGQLTVRVRGPKGAFRVEMQRESQKDRTILCKFDPTEPGDYRVEVKWAGELVPGSPFVVMIFDTQDELNRFVQGSHSPGSEMYGSVGYSTGYAHMNFNTTQPSWRGSQPQL